MGGTCCPQAGLDARVMGTGGSLGNPRRGSHHTRIGRGRRSGSPRRMLAAGKVLLGRQVTALPAGGYLARRANGVPAHGAAGKGLVAYRMVGYTLIKLPLSRFIGPAHSTVAIARPRFGQENRDGRPARCRPGRSACDWHGLCYNSPVSIQDAPRYIPGHCLGLAGVLADRPRISGRDQSSSVAQRVAIEAARVASASGWQIALA